MKVAVQTISWGSSNFALSAALNSISRFGIKAVELSQSPWRMGGPLTVGTEDELRKIAEGLDERLDSCGLSLLGLAGGSLGTKYALGRYLKNKPQYIYIDSWDPEYEGFLDKEIPLAFHPHVFNGHSTLSELRKLFTEYPQLRFLPDTAHLHLLQLNTVEILEEFKSKIIAIHLKDWDNRYGWSRVMYARGFTELGKGGLKDLSRIWDWILKNFEGFCVVEQDFSAQAPEESIRASLKWLGVELPAPSSSQKPNASLQGSPPAIEEVAAGTLRAFRRPLADLYSATLDNLANYCDASYVSLWELNSQAMLMTREAISSRAGIIVPEVAALQIHGTMVGEAVKEQAIVVKRFGASDFFGRDRLSNYSPQFRDLIEGNQFGQVVSIPIFNVYNSHAVDFVISLYFRETRSINAAQLLEAADCLAVIFDSKLNEMRSDIFDRFSTFVSEYDSIDDFLLQDVPELLSLIDARDRYIYLSHGVSQPPALRLACIPDGTGKIAGRLIDPDYRVSPVGAQFVQAAFDSRSARSAIDLFDPLNTGTTEQRPIIAVPIFAPGLFGVPRGVLVCTGRRKEPHTPFAMHDEILLDALQVGLGAQLERTFDSARRADSMRAVRHEMGNPLGCIANALAMYQAEKKDFDQQLKRRVRKWSQQVEIGEIAQIPPDNLFQFKPSRPLFTDIEEWLKTADAVLQGRGFLTAKGAVEIHPQPVKLLYQIVRPAVKQVLKDRSDKVRFGNLAAMPVLMVDKQGFTQVFLNLIINAFKYRRLDADGPEITFSLRSEAARWRITIEDRGIGVEPGYEAKIFDKGVRTPLAMQNSAVGDGFGLWLVKKILVAHNCGISLTNNQGPTRFEITIPKELELRVNIE